MMRADGDQVSTSTVERALRPRQNAATTRIPHGPSILVLAVEP
jgi:hypothetical protein